MTLDDVITIYGNPQKDIDIADWFNKQYVFEDFAIYANGIDVVGITALTENACTHHNVCISDNFTISSKTLGTPSNIINSSDNDKYIYAKPKHYCSYQVSVKNNLINKIQIKCTPD